MSNDTPKVKVRSYSLKALVARLEKEELNQPQVCYEFSNGEQRVDTDRSNTGIYERD